MSILVTGGTGFIGSHTTVELINAGYDVVIIDNLVNSCREVINRIEKITGKRPAFYENDLLDKAAVEKIFNEKTFEKLLVLLEKYGSEYYFNRRTIANAFGITENAASRIIRKAVDCGIMRKEKKGVYYFNMR